MINNASYYSLKGFFYQQHQALPQMHFVTPLEFIRINNLLICTTFQDSVLRI